MVILQPLKILDFVSLIKKVINSVGLYVLKAVINSVGLLDLKIMQAEEFIAQQGHVMPLIDLIEAYADYKIRLAHSVSFEVLPGEGIRQATPDKILNLLSNKT